MKLLFVVAICLACVGPLAAEAVDIKLDQRLVETLLRVPGVRAVRAESEGGRKRLILYTGPQFDIGLVNGMRKELLAEFDVKPEVKPPIVALSIRAGATTRNSVYCTQGVIGLAAKTIAGGNYGYVASNHVAAADRTGCPNNRNAPGQYSPAGTETDCVNPQDKIGDASKPELDEITTTGPNYIDAAFVRTMIPVSTLNPCGVCLTGISTAAANDPVMLCRDGVAYTSTVKSVTASPNVEYRGCGPDVPFLYQIEIDGAFAMPGDSGAAVYTVPVNGKATVVGFVMAGDLGSLTYLNVASEVMRRLKVEPVMICP